MKKRIFTVCFALVMVLVVGCFGCGSALAASDLAMSVADEVCIPFVETLDGATLESVEEIDENTLFLIYSNADEEDLDLLLSLYAYCGLYRYGGPEEDGLVIYNMIRPGSDYLGQLLFDAEAGVICLKTTADASAVDGEELQRLTDYYWQDLVLPSGYGPNVHPEFFASIGRGGADRTGLTDNVFGDEPEQCWIEVYAKVDYPKLHAYLSDMLLCGFDVWYDGVELSEKGTVDMTVFTLDNGTSTLVIVYYADTQMANVFYEPGIDRYLLKGQEYAKYIPAN